MTAKKADSVPAISRSFLAPPLRNNVVENIIKHIDRSIHTRNKTSALHEILDATTKYAADIHAFQSLFENDPGILDKSNPEFVIILDEKFTVVNATNNCHIFFNIELDCSLAKHLEPVGRVSQQTNEHNGPIMYSLSFSEGKTFHASLYTLFSDFFKKNLYLLRIQCVYLDFMTRTFLKSVTELTEAECDVVQALLLRLTVEEISILRNTSINTVRKHVEKIIKKTKTKNITQACIYVVEQKKQINEDVFIKTMPPPYRAKRSKRFHRLKTSDLQIEFKTGGCPNGTPMLYLHSIESAFFPPQSVFDAAEKLNVYLIAVIRPGFGNSSQTKFWEEDVSVYASLLKSLNIKKFIIIAQTTAIPIGVKLLEHSSQAKGMAIINFVPGEFTKLKRFYPKWFRALIELSRAENERLNLVMKIVLNTITIFGPTKFHNSIYLDCLADKVFCIDNKNTIEAAANRFIQTEPSSLAFNIKKSISILENESFENVTKQVVFIRGADSMPQLNEELSKFCKTRNMPYFLVSNSGRYCLHQKPKKVLAIICREFCITNT